MKPLLSWGTAKQQPHGSIPGLGAELERWTFGKGIAGPEAWIPGVPCCLPLPPNVCVPSALALLSWQILIRNRATDLDARMHDGTTPLILAARLAVEGMLDDLINCHADVNAVDDLGTEAAKTAVQPDVGQKGCLLLISALTDVCCVSWFSSPGKSALHWAAAVNNVEAAMVLLKNGANKDMQNNKVRSPRLKYAREEPLWESVKE